MARDYASKTNYRQQKNSKLAYYTLISFGVLLAILMLIIAIKKHEEHKQVKLATSKQAPLPTLAKKALPPKPQFDFYTILPKEKVWVPKSAIQPIAAPKEPSAPIAYILQVAAFKNITSADQLQQLLHKNGYSAHVKLDQQSDWYKVWLGPYESLAKAQSIQVSVSESNHLSGLVLTINE